MAGSFPGLVPGQDACALLILRIPGLLLLQNLLLVPRALWIPGFLSRRETLALRQAARAVPPGGHIVEVGCWKGKSSYCLARGLRFPGSFTAIDPFDARGEGTSQDLYQKEQGDRDLESVFRDNVRPVMGRHEFRVIRGTSSSYPTNGPPIDLLFIDGDHSWEAVSRDLSRLEPFLKSGGLLLLHDCAAYSPTEGPRRLRDEILSAGRFRSLRQIDALWIGEKL